MESKAIKLEVTNTIGEDNKGFIRVTVGNELFNALIGYAPKLPFNRLTSAKGEQVREFDVEGTKVYATYDKVSKKTLFIMKTEDAKQHHSPVGNAPFDISTFDLTVTKTSDLVAKEEVKEEAPAV